MSLFPHHMAPEKSRPWGIRGREAGRAGATSSVKEGG